MNRKLLVLPVLTGLTVSALAGCGGSDSDSGSGDEIVVGTTDSFKLSKETPAPLDPVTGYDIGTWNIFNNTFQTLLRYPRSGTTPEPEAAKECGFTDDRGELYRCELNSGLKFSNGHALTSEDVKYSVDRMIGMKNDAGPHGLLANVDTVETPSDTEVVFHLKESDTTFPYKLATPAAAIVDSEVYPESGLLNGYEVAGSGPYQLTSFTEGDNAVFEKNPNYQGNIQLQNGKVELRFFEDSESMEKALTNGEIDVMNRTMTPEQITRFTKSAGDEVQLTEAPGSEIRYLVFNTDHPAVKDPAVRQAFAQVVDRQQITREAYQRTAEPLYSLVPQGIVGHKNSFFNEYEEPDVEKAGKILDEAGISTPIELTLDYTTEHYGAATAEEFKLLKKQLDASGLFKVTLRSEKDWSKYQESGRNGEFSVYGMGWFPDFPDPESFISPFLDKDNFLNTPYKSRRIQEEILPSTRVEADRTATASQFAAAQDLVATDVPLLPIWQGTQYIAARSGITGTEWALNASSSIMFWELGRSVTG